MGLLTPRLMALGAWLGLERLGKIVRGRKSGKSKEGREGQSKESKGVKGEEMGLYL